MTMDAISSIQVVLTWTSEDVAKWLACRGLQRYVNKFKRYMVTGPVLLQLDDTLLDDLDVTDSSDRQILTDAVTRFTGSVEDCLKNKTNSDTDDNGSSDKECDEKATAFPAFAELLPTIGEEDEFDDPNDSRGGESSKHLPIITIDQDSPSKETEIQSSQDDTEPVKNTKTEEKYAHIAEDTASKPSKTMNDDEVASRATQIVQIFSEENKCLRKQLEQYYKEIAHLQNIAKELRSTQIMYKDLKSAFINREHKEKAMRSRLEAEITQLQHINAELSDELREAQNMIAAQPKDEIEKLKEEITKREEEVKQLQKERKIFKTSLQNLERMLKQKSSEIIGMQRQQGIVTCDACGCEMEPKQIRETKTVSRDDLSQFYDSMIRSSRGRGTNSLLNKSLTSKQRLDIRINQNSANHDGAKCVPVLVELIREKDAEIARLRDEIRQMNSRYIKESSSNQNSWRQNTIRDKTGPTSHDLKDNDEMFTNHRHAERRYSELETAIRSLHVQLAEKDAVIQILQCKYGENSTYHFPDASSRMALPFRTPSFTSQTSSVSSYQDSGIVATSDGHNGEKIFQDTKGTLEVEALQITELECGNRNDRRPSTEQEEDQSTDHCWFF